MSKEIDLKEVKKHWENPHTISLKDHNLQELERLYITESLRKIGKVGILADIGCGDGIDTAYWRNFAKEVIGYDYSSSMIKKAKRNLRGKAGLFQIDLLKDRIPHVSDVVITKRCLINLGGFENQKKALLKIHRSIRKKGHYVMLECCEDGLRNLNILRKGMDLDPLEEPFHNTYFNIPLLSKFIQKYFVIEKLKYFSTYYFLTRVYNQLLEKKNFKKFDLIAKKLHIESDIFESRVIGPQFLMVLRKK